MKKARLIIFLFTLVIIAMNMGINVVYSKIGNLSMETKLRILISDVKNTENIFANNSFDVRTDYFAFTGYKLTDLSYTSNDLVYDIYCTTSKCSILGKTSSEAKICIDIEKSQYSVYYNNDYTIYSAEYIKNIENTFSEKINTIYRDYTKETYTDEHKNKLHYFFHYLYSKMKL